MLLCAQLRSDHPTAHRQGVASRDPQAQGESGWGRPPGLVRPPQSSGARSPQAPLLLPHCSREHPQGSAWANPAPVSSHTCPDDLSPRPSLGQDQPQARHRRTHKSTFGTPHKPWCVLSLSLVSSNLHLSRTCLRAGTGPFFSVSFPKLILSPGLNNRPLGQLAQLILKRDTNRQASALQTASHPDEQRDF